MTKTTLAARIGKKETKAWRILDPNYPTKLQTLEQTLKILGRRIVITVEKKQIESTSHISFRQLFTQDNFKAQHLDNGGNATHR